mgnify:CR=1 FL=1
MVLALLAAAATDEGKYYTLARLGQKLEAAVKVSWVDA